MKIGLEAAGAARPRLRGQSRDRVSKDLQGLLRTPPLRCELAAVPNRLRPRHVKEHGLRGREAAAGEPGTRDTNAARTPSVRRRPLLLAPDPAAGHRPAPDPQMCGLRSARPRVGHLVRRPPQALRELALVLGGALQASGAAPAEQARQLAIAERELPVQAVAPHAGLREGLAELAALHAAREAAVVEAQAPRDGGLGAGGEGVEKLLRVAPLQCYEEAVVLRRALWRALALLVLDDAGAARLLRDIRKLRGPAETAQCRRRDGHEAAGERRRRQRQAQRAPAPRRRDSQLAGGRRGSSRALQLRVDSLIDEKRVL
mmetsp:Transcript_13695/g.43312  ORF Transcript_13695/g.43312 Transcript_13695/m.43312 type:complete len:316 (+) Transcript_13695:215-1162(+)